MRQAALLFLLLAASPALAQTDPVVAQRGGFTLTAGAVRELLKQIDPDQRQKLQSDPQAMSAFVRERMLQSAVLDEAHAKAWDQRPEIAARAEQARNAAIADSYVTSITQPEAGYPSEADIQSAYEQNKAKLVLPRQYHLAQILVAVPQGAAKSADDEARARAADLRAQALRPKGDFAALAHKESDDKKSAAVSGDLGFLAETQLLPAVRGVVAGMTEGAVSDPLRLGDGWHVFRLIGTKPAAPATLADVHDTLSRALRQARQQQNAQTYLQGLLQREPVQINEIELGNIAGK